MKSLLPRVARTILMLSCWALAFVAVWSAGPATAQDFDAVHRKAPKKVIENLDSGVSQEVIVVFDDQPARQAAKELQSSAGLASHHHRVIEAKAARFEQTKRQALAGFEEQEVTAVRQYSHLPAGFLRVHSRRALERLVERPEVIGVFENGFAYKFLAESLPLIDQPQAQAAGNLGAGTAVAVLDTGVDYTRSAFGSCPAPGGNCKVAYAQDFTSSDGKLDDNGHGTNVAGTVLGVAPGTKILALDVFSGDTAPYDAILSAMNWVIANKTAYNIVAMNMSLGSGKYTAPITNGVYNAAIAQARAAGILTVVASGNDGYSNAIASPAAAVGAVSVGAVYDSYLGSMSWGGLSRCSDVTTAANQVTCFSNSASFLTMLAPGSQITAAGITQSGTSQAAPHAAGAVAVLRAAFPNETLEQTLARLTNGDTITDPRNDIAKPRLNLTKALGQSAACSFAISETSVSFPATGSTGSVAVTASTGCSWHAGTDSGSSGWITITSGATGTGNGTVHYQVAANPNAVSRTGTLTVAGKSYTVTQSGSTATTTNILLNPGFEQGPVSWSESTAIGLPIISAYLNPTNAANSWYAWLCGYNNCADTLYQDLTIPGDAQTAGLTFKYLIDTEESTTTTAYDSLTIRVYSPPGAGTYHYWSLSNLNSGAGWATSPGYDLSSYRGQTVRLQFSATTDSSFITNFYLDDLSLSVTGATPDTQPPTVPTGLSAVASGRGTINLTWNPATDNVAVSNYRVYRDGSWLVTLGQVTAYADTGLMASTSYSYTVSACDTAGNCSAQSPARSATTSASDAQAPTVPTGLSAIAVDSASIRLSWNPASDNVGVTGYKLYRNGTLSTELGNVNSYKDTGLTPSTSYSYTVSACDAAGNCSPQSGAVQASTYAPFPLGSPLVFSGPSSFTTSGGSVNIKVDRITNQATSGHSGSLKLQLWALTAPYFGGSVTGYITASVRTNQIAGLSDTINAGTYFYNLNLNLPYAAPPANYTNFALFLLEYDPVDCATSDGFCIVDYINYHESQPPTVPTGLTAAQVSSSQIGLTWNPASDNVGVATYKLYRNGLLVSLLGNITSYTDGGLKPSTSYSYTLAACDAVGNCSAQSAAASTSTKAAPDLQAPNVPTGLSARVVGSTSIQLTWNASSDNVGVTNYQLFSGGALVATLGNVTGSTRTVTPGTSYSYSVAACDAAGNCSARSAAVQATTPAAADTEAPSVPLSLRATALGASRIDLTWQAATDNVAVTQYWIQGSDGSSLTVGPATTYSHTGLRSSTTYSYQVSACDAAANCSALSATASATTANPDGARAGDCDGSGTVSIAEVQSAINMLLGSIPLASCADVDGNGTVSAVEVQKAINSFLGF